MQQVVGCGYNPGATSFGDLRLFRHRQPELEVKLRRAPGVRSGGGAAGERCGSEQARPSVVKFVFERSNKHFTTKKWFMQQFRFRATV